MDFKNNSVQKISYILKFYRRSKNFSQQNMAELLNISHRNYQRLECGEVEPKLETLSQISSILNISTSSLLCSSNVKVLDLSELSTYNEFKNFKEVEQKAELLDHTLLFAKMLIENDKKINPNQLAPVAKVEGDRAYLCPILKELIGSDTNQIDVDDFLMFGNCVERWEIVFRNKLKNPIIENTFIFPKGIFVFEEYHYNLNPSPDNPTTECLIRDVTDRHNLEQWVYDQKYLKNGMSIRKRHLGEAKIIVK